MIRRLVLFILVAPLILVAGAALWLLSSLPVIDGTERLAGLSAPVTIERDEWGVPRIRAANERDAAFALGYVHAQDRLFQMEQMRRVGAGRLSEVLGERTLPIDRMMRTFGLYRAAEAQLAQLSPELRAYLEAYVAGVNAWIGNRTRALPPEYYLLRFRPEPWRVTDTLVYGKLMALQLAGNYRGERLRARIAERLGRDALDLLFPRLESGASNNWVVDGSRSASGKPVLANDPHLGFAAPGNFYLARLEWGGGSVAGATAPGAPFVIIGHNERIAWGFTTTGGDVEDLFVEKLEGERYATPDGSEPFVVRQETIAVRGKAPETLTIRSTRHGPVVSEIFGDATPGHVLALQATFLAEDDRTPEALYGMNRARSAEEFLRAVEDWAAPQQSMVFADTDGHTGMIAPARMPVRKNGEGWLPSPGWDGETDWTGFIPFEELPHQKGSRLVTANNKIVPDDYPWFISRDWDLPYRAERITALLDAAPLQTPDRSAEIQADVYSPMAADLLPLLLDAPATSVRARGAVETLRRWDRAMREDEVAPLLFVAWIRELERTLFADALGPLFEEYFDFRPEVLRRVIERDHPRDKIAAALERALGDLERRFGTDMEKWSWGRAHRARFQNSLLSRVPVLEDFVDASIPAPGGYDTINRGHMALRNDADPFASVHGSVLRFIIDMAEPDAARFMIVPGQSGNPFSRHWSDLLRPWHDFRWITFGGAPADRLELVPP
jgi:penicillin G amidase